MEVGDMRSSRALTAALIGVLAAGLTAAPALAAPPPNDELAGATSVSVGDVVTQDTSEAATTDPFEDSLNAFCGAPVVEHGVWFSLAATSGGFVATDTSGSDFEAGMMVFEGTPTPEGLLTCGPDHVVFEVFAGTDYSILAFGDGESAATGGSLVFAVSAAAPPPQIDITLPRFGTVDRSDQVRLAGTVRCESADGSGILFELFGDISQRVGRLTIRGFFFTELGFPCDGSSREWEVHATGENGVFRGGKAATIAIAFGCSDLCSEGYAEGVVQLKRSSR
jgi:hypothetical protein